MSSLLVEHLSYDQAQIKTERTNEGKDLYMVGICIQGGVKNANQRVYPLNEIARAIETVNKQAQSGYSVLGELDHPANLRINLDRVTHVCEKMWMEGQNGYGKLKILPTPMGQIVKTLLDSGVKLGVSSRGSGNVDDMSGKVSDFEIVTVDIVAQPSAPDAYPTAVYEGLLNMRGGHRLLGVAAEANRDQRVQKYLQSEMVRLINEMKLK